MTLAVSPSAPKTSSHLLSEGIPFSDGKSEVSAEVARRIFQKDPSTVVTTEIKSETLTKEPTAVKKPKLSFYSFETISPIAQGFPLLINAWFNRDCKEQINDLIKHWNYYSRQAGSCRRVKKPNMLDMKSILASIRDRAQDLYHPHIAKWAEGSSGLYNAEKSFQQGILASLSEIPRLDAPTVTVELYRKYLGDRADIREVIYCNQGIPLQLEEPVVTDSAGYPTDPEIPIAHKINYKEKASLDTWVTPEKIRDYLESRPKPEQLEHIPMWQLMANCHRWKPLDTPIDPRDLMKIVLEGNMQNPEELVSEKALKKFCGIGGQDAVWKCILGLPVDQPIAINEQGYPSDPRVLAKRAINYKLGRSPYERVCYFSELKPFLGKTPTWQELANCHSELPLDDPIDPEPLKDWIVDWQINIWRMKQETKEPLSIENQEQLRRSKNAVLNFLIGQPPEQEIPVTDKGYPDLREGLLPCQIKWFINYKMDRHHDSDVQSLEELSEFLGRVATEQELDECNKGAPFTRK